MSDPLIRRPPLAGQTFVINGSGSQVNRVLPPGFREHYAQVTAEGVDARVAFSLASAAAPTLAMVPTASAEVEGILQPSANAGDLIGDTKTEHYDLTLTRCLPSDAIRVSVVFSAAAGRVVLRGA